MSTGAAEPRTSIGASSPNRFVRTPQPPRRRLGSRPRLPEPSDAAIRKLTGEILARPEFASAISKEPVWTQWLRTFLKWLQKIQLLHDTSPVLYWMIVAAVAIIRASLVVHVIWTLWIPSSAPPPSSPLATYPPPPPFP